MFNIAGRAFVFAIAMTIAAGQSPKLHEYALGAVTVIIPPPEGFEDASTRQEVRDRFPASDKVDTLAIHLPASVMRTFDPEQDLTFYTQVAVAKASKTDDMPASMIAEFAERFAKGEMPDQKKQLAELAARGWRITESLNLGVFDRTPSSFSGLLLSGLSVEGKSANILRSTSLIHLKARIVNVFVFRKFETEADRTVVEDFTKTWVRRIIAANP